MEPKENEEELLKSAALQTANAVLVARRRAEQELIRDQGRTREKERGAHAFALHDERHAGVEHGCYSGHGRKRASDYMESKIHRHVAYPIGT